MTPPDTLNAIGVLTRREIEARLLAPLIDAFAQTSDRAQVIATVRDTIADIARNQGAEMARAYGEATIANFADSLKLWTKDDALVIDIVEHSNNGSSTCRAALLIENDDNYLSVTAGRDNYKDKNNSAATNSFVELEFFHSGDKVLDADDYRSKHWAARLGGDCKGFSDSQSGMIDKITPDLVDAGVTSIRFWADPSVDFAELTKGPGFVNFLGFNKEELPSGRVEPTGYGNADWASQRLIASDMIDFARDKNIIDQEDKELLKNVLNRAIGQQNILLLLGAYTPGYNMMSAWGCV